MNSKILQGNNIDVLRTFPDNHFDSIVTDPPYGIAFLGKDWDSRKASETTSKIAQLHNLPSGMKHTSLADDLEFQYWMRDVFAECMRVLKPGGHLLAFSAARTYHHMAMAAQTAGFEIRDQIMWIYSSGFPKSQDVGRQLHKKAHGKPDKQRFDKDEMEIHYSPGGGSNGFGRLAFSETEPAKNAQTTMWRHKVNGKIYKALPDINGDRLAVSHEGEKYGTVYEEVIEVDNEWSGWGTCLKPAHEPIVLARKPIKLSIAENCQHWGVGALNIDATRIEFEDEKTKEQYAKQRKANANQPPNPRKTLMGSFATKTGQEVEDKYIEPTISEIGRFPSNVIGEIANYQKYFYCPKVSRKERHIGFDPNSQGNIIDSEVFGKTPVCLDCGLTRNGSTKHDGCDPANIGFQERRTKRSTEVGNNHPTVKPIELMKYLIRLVTPAGGRVLDPFNGSGSTGCAAVELDYDYTGIELDERYVEIAEKRIAAWYAATHNSNFDQVFEIL